ncbi:hypothetical protein NQ176_g8842 [Zarea fungicola]|uniref:Uncharacterized protein n=1 Tax=Zarea fungicola TaxID=93591 RepID=A0ACC1MRZ2_9HYPO|nr:hypothetical protein NQ176_g8842 [Lecanicillium fungicola]
MPLPDILDLVHLVGEGSLSNTVLSLVQSRSFTAVQLCSDVESLAQFSRVFSDLEIRGLVKTIHYDIVLPRLSDSRLQRKLQSRREATANNVAFTRAIVKLFGLLRDWDIQKGIRLQIAAASPSDTRDFSAPSIKVKPYRNALKFLAFDDNELRAAHGLPTVSCIGSLCWDIFDVVSTGSNARRAHPSIIRPLCTALPLLTSASWLLCMPARRLGMQLRREHRETLAQALILLPLENFRSLTICLLDPEPFNHLARPGAFVAEGDEDALSLAVQKLLELPVLSELRLEGKWTLDPSAFTGSPGPAMREIWVDGALVTPSGKWLTAMPENTDSEQSPTDSSYDIEHVLEVNTSIDSDDSEVEDPEVSQTLHISEWERNPAIRRFVPKARLAVPLLCAFASAIARAPNRQAIRYARLRFSDKAGRIRYNYLGAGECDSRLLNDNDSDMPYAIDNSPIEHARWYVDPVGQWFDGFCQVPDDLKEALEAGVGSENIRPPLVYRP